MKIRNGFVSNSSTTSFAIVGINIDPYYDKDKHPIKTALANILSEFGTKSPWDYEKYGFGTYKIGDGLSAYTCGEDFDYIGIELIDKFRKGVDFKTMKDMLIKKIFDKFLVDVPEELIDIYIGSAGSG